MKRKSLSAAKNTMRRALADLIDPPPTEKQQLTLREHFGHCCCYCGASAPLRSGHIDHADPKAGNGLGNFLLACSTCNGDEKREMTWEAFLHLKCGHDSVVHAERRTRIVGWLDGHRADVRSVSREISERLIAAEKAIESYEAAYNELRRVVVASRRVG